MRTHEEEAVVPFVQAKMRTPGTPISSTVPGGRYSNC